MQNEIKQILERQFSPSVLTVTDDSAKHAGHAGVQGLAGNTHFAILIVSDAFAGKSLVERHRLIYDCLKKQFQQTLHALAIQAYTPQEFQARN